jgi:predicted DCC family thiol-disulfide oxidoreductase YuxK
MMTAYLPQARLAKRIADRNVVLGDSESGWFAFRGVCQLSDRKIRLSRSAEGGTVPRHFIRNVSMPAATESKPILFFDGVCGLCNRFVDFVLKYDRHGRVVFAPLQGSTAAASLPEDIVQGLDTVVFLDGDRWQIRSSAIVRIFWRLGGAWSVLGTLLWLIPKPIRDLGYKIVARSRYRWFGQKETCRLPTPAERARFLD